MRDTYITSKHQEEPSWFIIDANNQTLGRLATKVSLILQGKENRTYSPATKFRNYVIVINADKINLTGRKKTQKIYYSLRYPSKYIISITTYIWSTMLFN